MNEFKVSDVPESKKADAENYRDIKPESDMSVKKARGFWDNKFGEREETGAEQKENLGYVAKEIRMEGEDVKKFYTTWEEREDRFPINGEWMGDPGNSKFKTNDTEVNKILESFGLDGIEYKDGVPDFSKCAIESIEIDHMTSNLVSNYKQFCEKCAEKWSKDDKLVKPSDVRAFKVNNNLDFHECSDMKTCQLVPREIHKCFTHTGGRMECKKRDGEENKFDE